MLSCTAGLPEAEPEAAAGAADHQVVAEQQGVFVHQGVGDAALGAAGDCGGHHVAPGQRPALLGLYLVEPAHAYTVRAWGVEFGVQPGVLAGVSLGWGRRYVTGTKTCDSSLNSRTC